MLRVGERFSSECGDFITAFFCGFSRLFAAVSVPPILSSRLPLRPGVSAAPNFCALVHEGPPRLTTVIALHTLIYMEMTSLSIDLPEPLKVFVELEAEESGCATASDYIRALIRDAEHRKSEHALDALLSEGLNRRDCGEMSDAEWESHKQHYRARRLEELRREIAVGLTDAALGNEVSADDAFRRLEARNQRALERR